MSIASVFAVALEVYAAIGLIFGLAFVFAGVSRVDAAAQGAPLGFRLLILPASAAFWPWLAVRWMRGTPPRDERNAHRDAARPRGGAA